ncbi:transcription-repair coupling factor [Alphaproteobacteria bacterium]|nr:transcription-repair coupling factor [Alphaproteobacteria bacterium]
MISLSKCSRTILSGTPEGLDGLVLADIAASTPIPVIHVARDDKRLALLSEMLAVFSPDLPVLQFPAWDCLPYDRVSPNIDVASARVHTLGALLARRGDAAGPLVILTTVSAILQRIPPARFFENTVFCARKGNSLDLAALTQFLTANGYNRTSTVREPGEFALRGGIIDIFPSGFDAPCRLDLFGDEIERLRQFDPITQHGKNELTEIVLQPISELFLDKDSISQFRSGYRDRFGGVENDPLYDSVSAGIKAVGSEHWLPLFYDHLETLFDYVPKGVIIFDYQVEDTIDARFQLITDFYDARLSALEASRTATSEMAPPYRPLPPDLLYLTANEWESAILERATGWFSPFSAPGPAEGIINTIDMAGRRCQEFAVTRVDAQADYPTPPGTIFDAVRDHIATERQRGRRTAIAAYSGGSRDRLARVLEEHGLGNLQPIDNWPELDKLPITTTGLLVLGLEHGFSTDDITVIGEQDILGDRLDRPMRKQRRAEAFIADTGELSLGDHVVHIEHGIGKYEGLETIVAGNTPHDCLRVAYSGGDRLFVPVENIEVLSRFGSPDAAVTMDRLGGAGWQSRKAKLKNRLREMADELIKIAALRALKPARKLVPETTHFEEFCARFPYDETDDQQTAIDETIDDLSSGQPMDRLICGDVGFGKTEVALRAAFATVMAGGQVAVIVPTTLLCRQHYATFIERFRGYPVRTEQLSRLVTPKSANATKQAIAEGTTEIVIGTHALLSKSMKFRDLALVIVDEEQHFGVAHKERLKQLRTNVHVLTLTATPIPRTLQMALTGVKDLSMIATPPVDRLAVRTFVIPYDPVIIREAIMRERFRGGQIFYVCPRIRDLPEIQEQLRELLPDVEIAIAHGQMSPRALEDVMNRYYDGNIELLLSTQIVESGLDIPTANTLIIHRADMFGLAQLYQLRGRIGRSKVRAYCYLTLPPRKSLTETATKRLEVMQSLDTLGAGFTLASHDLDIRGAGNLLGEEQSGHIREVGTELYQQMLEEAVATARGLEPATDMEWSPQITIGTPILIPGSYVEDLDLRLSLYRRLAGLDTIQAIERFAAEMIDRFGPLPIEIENLLQVITIKQYCRRADIEKLDAGPKGAIISFHNNSFARPEELIRFIQDKPSRISLRPDHRLVVREDWTAEKTRLRGARILVSKLAEIAQPA